MTRLPYPGLRPFRRDESDLFFGRESCVDEMVARLATTRFLSVLGPSGSGKSSLVRTGLLDALELGLMAGAGPRWLIADLRPAGRPIENLARALLGLPGAASTTAAAEADVAQFAAQLRRGPRSVIQWWRNGNLPERTNLLILVDQFEELFRYSDYAEREAAEAFVALLLESAAAEGLPIYVVLTMRSEFLGPCALFPDLAERINAGLYLTRRMTREETRDAIVGPAGVCGFAIEPAFVNRLLNDLASFAPWEGDRGTDQLQLLARRADQLPLMQHVLNRLWLGARAAEAEGSGPITLRLAAYEELGGLVGALNTHADEVLASIEPESRAVAETVFRALVSGATIATAVRRPCRFDELVTLAAGNRAAVERVVEAFRAPDCNFLVVSPPGPLTDASTLDISHESLIRQWLKLSEWMLAEGQAADEYRYLEKTANRWKEGRAELLRMPYLGTALAWWKRERPSDAWALRYGGDFGLAARFLERSGRRRRALRRLTLALASVAGLLIIVGVPLFILQQMELSRLKKAAQFDNLGTAYLTGIDTGYLTNVGSSSLPGKAPTGSHGIKHTKDYRQAMTYFRQAAALGSVDGEYRVGFLYENGYGVPQDHIQAMVWFKKAAARGYPAAQTGVGYLYLSGYGIKRDSTQAMYWLIKASDQGQATAQYDIGLMYANGLGVKEDYRRALRWFRKAADGGDADAVEAVGWFTEQGYATPQNYAAAIALYRQAADHGSTAAATEIGYLYENGTGVKQDYVQAMTWYRMAAAQGDPDAENGVGTLYDAGHGVPKDYDEALIWFRRAADGGSTLADYNLGLLFDNGEGVKQDYAQAVTWYRKAADQGDASAQFNLGLLLENGQGVKQDYAQAATLFLKAADQGYSAAANSLGLLFDNGHGVKRDYAQAAAWYRKAADKGDETAEYNLGLLFDNGEGVKQDSVAAAGWYRKAADQGYAAAQYNLGVDLQIGQGVKQDYSQAAMWYRKAADQSYSGAEFNLGLLYKNGQGVKQDYAQAAALFRQAADKGDPAAENGLGLLFDNGEGVKQDSVAAAVWYRKAAEQGNAPAQYNLGMLFERGQGVKQDSVEAAVWYRKAADQGDAAAEFNLGLNFEIGQGVKQDYVQAAEWYRKAADQGYAHAEYRLGRLFANGQGVAKSDASAMAWFSKAAAQGDARSEQEIGEILAREGKATKALAAYEQTVTLAQSAVAKDPTDPDTKRRSAETISGVAFELLLQGAFQNALDAATIATGLEPDVIWLQGNRADALMMVGQTNAARAIYLQYKSVKNDGTGNPWTEDVLSDFAALRSKGYSSPLMAEIEADLRK